MFCFKCAEKMIIKNGYRYCTNGEMSLSPILNNKISELFEEKEAKTFPENNSDVPEKSFFCLNLGCDNKTSSVEAKCSKCNSEMRETTIYCPECGIPTQRGSETSVISEYFCISCKKIIDKNLLYQIIEFHPHKPY